MSKSTTIGVSRYVKDQLDALKKRNGHTSMDSLMRAMISTFKEKIKEK